MPQSTEGGLQKIISKRLYKDQIQIKILVEQVNNCV